MPVRGCVHPRLIDLAGNDCPCLSRHKSESRSIGLKLRWLCRIDIQDFGCCAWVCNKSAVNPTRDN